MRTTLTIDDDVFFAAKSLARSESKPLGEVISNLIRRGLAPRAQTSTSSGFPVFEVSPDAAPITLEMVRHAAEDG
ncbi:MAG: antitoxin [Thermoanaerobaculia bacterium]|nr:antitoxin [Thermoanaerobaculia bacterium]